MIQGVIFLEVKHRKARDYRIILEEAGKYSFF